MPKIKPAQHKTSVLLRKPYLKSTDAGSMDPLANTNLLNMPESPSSNRLLKKGHKNKTEAEILINSFLKHQQSTIQNIKMENLNICHQYQLSSKNALDKDQELTALKQQLIDLNQKLADLQSKLQESSKENDVLYDNEAGAKDRYATLEKNYGQKILIQNKILDEIKAQLMSQKSENEHLRTKIKTLVEENNILSSSKVNESVNYETQIQNLQINLEQTQTLLRNKQETVIKLQEQINNDKLRFKGFCEDAELITLWQKEILFNFECFLNSVDNQRVKFLSTNENQLNRLFLIYETHENKLKVIKRNNDNVNSKNGRLISTLETIQSHHKYEILYITQLNNKLNIQNKLNIKNWETHLAQLSDTSEQIKEREEIAITKLNNEIKRFGFIQKTLKDKEKDLIEKDNKIADILQEKNELEREKNKIIAELNYKINRIGSVFDEKVQSAHIVQNLPPFCTRLASNVTAVAGFDETNFTVQPTVVEPYSVSSQNEPRKLPEGSFQSNKRLKNKHFTIYDAGDLSDFCDDSDPNKIETQQKLVQKQNDTKRKYTRITARKIENTSTKVLKNAQNFMCLN